MDWQNSNLHFSRVNSNILQEYIKVTKTIKKNQDQGSRKLPSLSQHNVYFEGGEIRTECTEDFWDASNVLFPDLGSSNHWVKLCVLFASAIFHNKDF